MSDKSLFIPGRQFAQNKILYHGDILTRALQSQTVNPVMYEISLSGWCSEKCTYCFNMNNHSRQQLNEFQIRKVLEEIKRLGGKAVEFSGGGEPLISPFAGKAISFAHDLGLSVGIITNGVFIDETLAETIAATVSYCRVSIDSVNPATFLNIRGTSHLPSSLNGLRWLVEKKKNSGGKLLIGAHIVWINQSINDIHQTADYFSESGIDFLQIRPVDNVPGVKDTLRPMYSNIDLEKLQALTSCFQKGSFQITTSADKWNEVIQGTPSKQYLGCPGANFTAAIGHDNYLYMCCSKFGNPAYRIGSLSNHSLEELLTSEKRKQFIQNIDHTECLPQCRNHQLNKFVENFRHMNLQARKKMLITGRTLHPPLHYEFL